MKNIHIKKYNLLHIFFSVFFMIGMFVAFSSQADARIVVEGDREFTDEINNCLNTYRNAPGTVGDAIKELENSPNTHKISESPDWENTADDGTKARDGAGTGSHTRVSKEELDKLIEGIEELKNKDFCTAFLHEMWHAVDADRGTWSDIKKNNVWEDEIEATAFQNFIHAIRGVPPRTSYGPDISEFLLLTDKESGKTKISVETLVLSGSYFPKSQFRIGQPDACDSNHYHGGRVYGFKTKTSSEIVGMNDPRPDSCGFGKVSEVPIEKIDITLDQETELSKSGVNIQY